MAGEEKLKRIGESVARALGGGEGGPPVLPVEAPAPIGVEVEPPKPEKKSFIAATTEKLTAFVEKVSKGVPEAAKKFVREGERPRDARVLSVVEELLDMDEAELADPASLRRVGEKLIHIIQEAGPRSETGREAKKYLSRITAEHKSLADLRVQAQQLDASAPNAVDRLFDDSGTDALAGKPIEPSLRKYQQLLRYDESELHDTHKVAGYIEDLKQEAYKNRYPEHDVKEAVRRLQDVAVEVNQHTTSVRGERTTIYWRDVKHLAPPGMYRNDNEALPFFGSPEEVKTLFKGREGEREWFSKFVNGVYGVGKEQAHPELPDTYKWESFKDYMEFVHGPEAEVYIDPFRAQWNDRGRHEFIFKSLSYQPGSVEDKVKSFRRLLGADLDSYIKEYDYAEYALPLYMQSALDVMADKQARYSKSLEFMTAERENPLWDRKDKKARYITNDALYGKLRMKDAAAGLSDSERRLMWEIKGHLDIVGEGVMLWDSDVLVYSELYHEWIGFKRRYEELKAAQMSGRSLSVQELQELDDLPDIIRAKQNSYEQAREFEKRNGSDPTAAIRLQEYRNLSPMEIEVRKRLVAYLKAKGITDVPEWKIRDAIWGARMTMVGSGHLIAIGSFMATRPADESTLESMKYVIGKSIMRAPFAEDIQRIYNPELFMHRFGMGGEMGERSRGILRNYLLESKGFGRKKHHEGHKGDGHGMEESTMMREYLNFAENELGISFGELLAPGFFAGGGDFDATMWRLEAGAFDEVRKKFLESGGDPRAWENQALGIQLGMAGGKDETSVAERRKLFDRMLKREPSKFLQYLAGDTMNEIVTRRGLTEEEVYKLKRALSLAEVRMWDDQTNLTREIDLTGKDHFGEFVAPYLRQFGVTGEARIAACQGLLADVYREATMKREVGKGKNKYKTLLDAWADHKFPLTLALSDFNWKDVNFFKLGTAAMDRRGRDMAAMAQARDFMMDLLVKSEFLSPNDPLETLKKIKELRGAVNTYADTTVAETVSRELLRTFIEFNRNRAIHHPILSTLMYVPGMEPFMRNIAEADMGNLKDSKFLRKVIPGWEHFADKKLAHWPHSVAEALSYSIRYTGAHGNAYDEGQVADILATAQDMGMFTEHPEFAQQLRREFKATVEYRLFFRLFRKYWWVVIAATIALAAMKSIEDEEKRH